MPALTSGASSIACATPAAQAAFLDALGPAELRALPWLFDFWALDHQLPPSGDWRSWVILGGRGAGKTRAGAEWVRAQVEGPRATDPGRARRVALVGETIDQAREVMVFGDSGLLACAPPDRRPEWIAGRRLLVWPNGAQAQLFSAHDPEALRGPQFDAAWVDELAKWKKAEEAWDMLQLALRLGDDPRCCVTTTPRPTALMRALLERDGTARTHAPTEANAANLARAFLAEVRRRYAGSPLGRQELDGVMLSEIEGALWSAGAIAAANCDVVPDLHRVVVAVDPSAGGGDVCGIVVAGACYDGGADNWRAWVLEDASVAGSSTTWARAAIAAYERHQADRIVAEVNQGGDMVAAMLRQVAPTVPYKGVRAMRGKAARAEPVAALYEQGRVRHVRGLGALEDQMALMTHQGYRGRGSPDRADALVWALSELLLAPERTAPRVRGL
ncbi:Putative large terminase [Oceanicola granulosus HTCC2516]|uniref:Putative large terminase n=1 Tax=Oceanicola granulosus (strain ATCC BAA-861 / DSM 15982 / KCTC 12143 / HTCC2516) TaxID=314256 RepID=Q2CA59_OCEGH|nr:terminase family protein [Oceanicola granulosus]EAR49553.1 Putative large terminase [Oceanicola granulosus HTCC2516]